MEWIVLGFLAGSLFLYCLLGGADFGAGVLEMFFPQNRHEEYRGLVVRAMSPVWEANHIWLIILIVILFNGFPASYAEVSIYFHIPLLLMLIGIIFRGCAFTFRTYDAVKDHTREIYSLFFSWSSALTPVMFGVIIGGLMLGRVDPDAVGYFAKYVDPWFNAFSFCVGLFILSIFMFLGSIFLIGETRDMEMVEHFTDQAKKINMFMVVTGALVFIAAHVSGLNLLKIFFSHTVSIVGFIGATIPLLLLWKILRTGRPWMLRSIVGLQVFMILLSWCALVFPNFIFYRGGETLTFFEAAGPPSTMMVLGWSLIVGSLLFLPALYYLIVVFKVNVHAPHSDESPH